LEDSKRQNKTKLSSGKKIGRPKIIESKKKSEQIFVNLTSEQKEKLSAIAEKEDRSLSQICVQALKKTYLV
jgi:hypothetical protein